MSWQALVISFAAGILVGTLYGVLNVRSPAPPVIALLGLLGILIGESAVSYFRGVPSVVARMVGSQPAPETGQQNGAGTADASDQS